MNHKTIRQKRKNRKKIRALNHKARQLKRITVPKSAEDEVTQNLDYSTAQWVYHYLLAYYQKTNSWVDFTQHRYKVPVIYPDQQHFPIHQKILTVEDCILTCLEYLQNYFTLQKQAAGYSADKKISGYFSTIEKSEIYLQTAIRIYAEILPELWW